MFGRGPDRSQARHAERLRQAQRDREWERHQENALRDVDGYSECGHHDGDDSTEEGPADHLRLL
jgi:hypothetical protein